MGGGNSPPNSESCTNNFQSIKLLLCKPKKYFSANQQYWVKNLSNFSFWLNLNKAVWFTIVHDSNVVYGANAGEIMPWLI